MWEECANLIAAVMSMKIMGSLLLTPSHMRWDTSMFTAQHTVFMFLKCSVSAVGKSRVKQVVTCVLCTSCTRIISSLILKVMTQRSHSHLFLTVQILQTLKVFMTSGNIIHRWVSKMTGYGLDGQVSIPGSSNDCLFDTMSRLALGLTQPPIQYI
jgi:hypothetical protein